MSDLTCYWLAERLAFLGRSLTDGVEGNSYGRLLLSGVLAGVREPS